ncbi:bifunctional [glutamate--ammonia ligase]-adenylyl-L-tyrosine phosphorylase/[glutamate--ammonia-ligase] adenylyltransferase [Marinimicrobium sp. ABcell2]|uniref:bifunctional [glutamate--ammonia ligase]-adenylyl-L-tyrosine phosphorylase/[glutamate--ammonia-ligase] adenylyltransferase n=1 Tax=Marinimicrobium sp. ABcell2 TaxID=3069751 RepID=UPI00359C7C54
MLEESLLPEALRPTVRRLVEEFARSLSEKELESPEQCLGGAIEPKEFNHQLTRAFAASEYIAKTCTVNPELLLDLISSGDLFTPLTDAGYPALEAAVSKCETEADLEHCLRWHRQRAMVRIVWRDLNRIATLNDTTTELSCFADTAIQQALAFHYRHLVERWGMPVGEESGQAQAMVVLGMGKLGARELNVSSDIDLIFAYPESGETQGANKSLSNQEFFVRLGQKLIKSLDAPTADGFVFRVDMRLRPHGQSGALVLNYDAMEDYYQSQGRDWERYAMIKARPVAAVGGEHSEQAAADLMSLMAPFTYRQYIDFSVIESLRAMKGLIGRQVQRRGMHLDVKLGEGGIREVEFVVQVFQLIRGGREPHLRERQVRKLLPVLEREGYLPEGSGSALLEAYEFLRNTEHALQGYQDRQTQALPGDELGQLRLAWVMGYENWDAFNSELGRHRERVAGEFRDVIADPEQEESPDDTHLHTWLALWEGTLEGEEALETLRQHRCEQPERLLELVEALRNNRRVLSMQASSRERLDSFMPRLFSTLLQGTDQAAETLARITPLIESVARRSAYLVLLKENPTALDQLVHLCAASPWIADQLAHYPALLDELLTPESLYAPPGKDELRDELRREVLRLGWDDLEGHMETLRYFRSAHALRVAASEVTGALPLMKVSDYLTHLAEVILEHVLALAWEQLVARHGRPGRDDGSVDQNPEFLIVGYGKLGGIELGHGSDLDLVFIHNAEASLSTDGQKSLDNLTFYTRLGQRIIHILNTQTPSGKLYEVDMRLRPSGDSGMLVSSLKGFEKYQRNDAWTWEHQALVRARVVAGADTLAKEFNRVRANVLGQERDQDSLRKEVLAMREKMREHLASRDPDGQFHLKQDPGGIVDIEFMVQYAVLAWAAEKPELVEYTDNIRILGALENSGLLSSKHVAQLIDAYKAYRSVGHRLALQRQEAVLQGDEHFVDERKIVTGLWRQLLETHP